MSTIFAKKDVFDILEILSEEILSEPSTLPVSKKESIVQKISGFRDVNNRRSTPYTDVRFGIMTALPEEFAAVRVLIDDIESIDVGGVIYYSGTIPTKTGEKHKLILCMLPEMGNNSSTAFTTKMLSNFPNIEYIIFCGIAGGVPTAVHLGDVVVSTNGITQYDLGKNETEFIPRDVNKPCSTYLLSATRYFRANEQIVNNANWMDYLAQINKLMKEDFSRPSSQEEFYEFKAGKYKKVQRNNSDKPQVYYERIASANVVQKNPTKRDALHKEEGIFAIEMEGAGVRDAFYYCDSIGYLVVRGICDFCDETKNDVWHNYAAAVAAAYTRALIESIPVKVTITAI
jgi:nucleoside phosphorylase